MGADRQRVVPGVTAGWLGIAGATGFAAIVSLNVGVPVGIAQRLAAACVLVWLGVLSVRIILALPQELER